MTTVATQTELYIDYKDIVGVGQPSSSILSSADNDNNPKGTICNITISSTRSLQDESQSFAISDTDGLNSHGIPFENEQKTEVDALSYDVDEGCLLFLFRFCFLCHKETETSVQDKCGRNCTIIAECPDGHYFLWNSKNSLLQQWEHDYVEPATVSSKLQKVEIATKKKQPKRKSPQLSCSAKAEKTVGLKSSLSDSMLADDSNMVDLVDMENPIDKIFQEIVYETVNNESEETVMQDSFTYYPPAPDESDCQVVTLEKNPVCELLMSERGKEKLLISGYLMTACRSKLQKSGKQVRYWRCDNKSCKGTAKTYLDSGQHRLERQMPHSCGSSENKRIQIVRYRHLIRNKAKYSSEKPSEIIDSVLNEVDPELLPSIGNRKSLHRLICRTRSRIRPKESSEDIILPLQSLLTNAS